MSSEETLEETDGVATDTISVICNLLTDLLKNNIDTLSIPKPLKTTLKLLKRIFQIINQKGLLENTELSHRAETSKVTGKTSRDGGEDQRQDSSEE